MRSCFRIQITGQGSLHFAGALVSVRAVRSTGFAHNAVKPGINIAERNGIYAAESPVVGCVDICSCIPLRIFGEKRCAAVIQELIHDQAKGIDIRSPVQIFFVEDLRSKIRDPVNFGRRMGGLLLCPAGGQEAADLIIAGRINEKIGRFYIAVDHLSLLAVFQSCADLDTEPADFGFGQKHARFRISVHSGADGFGKLTLS